MSSEAVNQAVLGVASTVTVANYVEDTVLKVIPPDSFLDFQLFLTAIGGVSIRDLVFCVTATVTMKAASKLFKKDKGNKK